MADIENQLQFANSTPQEAAQNINDSRLFNMSPDVYKENKPFYETEADILKRTTNVTKGVAAYSSFSAEHTSLVKNDLKSLSQIENIFTEAKERVDGVDLSQKVNLLKTKFQKDPKNFTDDDALSLYDMENELRDRRDFKVEKPRKNEELVNKFLETRKEVNLFDAAVASLGAESAQTIATTSQIPSLLYDAYFYPANLLRSLRGQEEIKAPESLSNNPVAKHYTELAKTFRAEIPATIKSLEDVISQGDYENAGASLAVSVAGAIPNLAGLLATSVAAGPIAGMTYAGVQTATQSNIENQAKGLTPTQSLPNALAKGGIEVAMEKVGTLGIFKNLETQLTKSFGRDSSKKILLNMFGSILKGGASEFKEEALTSVAQDLTDLVSGVNRDALQGIVPRALGAGITGLATGAGIVTPAAAVKARSNVQILDNQKKAIDILDFVDDMRNGMESLKETEVGKSTEASGFLKTTLESLGVKNVFLDKEALQAWANNPQKAEAIRNIIDPTGQATAALNAPIKVNAHEFFPITMEYPELHDLYKLSPEAANAQQAQEFLTKVNEADIKRMAVFDKLQAPEATPEDTKMIQEALDPEQPSAVYPASDVFGEAEYTDLTNMDKAITPYMSEGEKTKFLNDQLKSRQEIVDNINDSAEFEMNQVMDVAMTELIEAEKEAQLQRLENNPDLVIVDRFTNFKALPNDPILQSLEGFQVKEGYSPLAIDPKTLPEELKPFLKDERLKKNKVFVKGGTDLNTSAALLGFANGGELLNLLSQTPTREEIANQRTEVRKADLAQEAKDQTGLNTVGIQKAYDARLTNALKSMDIMRTKFWSSTKAGFKKFMITPSINKVRYEAKDTISKTLIKDLNVNQFKVGERKSERIAADAILKNQVEKAFTNLDAVVKNIALAQQTQLAIGETNRAIRFFRKFNKASVIQELKDAGPLYHDAAMEILSNFNLTSRESTKDVRGSFNKWVSKVATGVESEFNIPERFQDQRLDLQDLTVEQVRQIKEALTKVLHDAKFKNKLFKKFENIKGLQTIERIGKLVDETARKVFDYDPKKVEVSQESKDSWWSRKADSVLKLKSYLERTQHIIEKLDDGKSGGLFNDLFWRPLVDASNRKKKLIKETQTHLEKLIEAFGKEEWENLASEFVIVDALKGKPTINAEGRISKARLFSMELNFGNEGNITELEKFGLTRDELRTILDTYLEDKHTALVQNIWNIYESFKPEMSELQKRTEGTDVKWVEAKPFTARGKEYPGGYYPIARLSDFMKVKAKESQGTGEMNRLDNFKQNYYGRAMTEQGHLESRTGNDDFLTLDLNVIGYSLNQVIHDLTHRETIADAVKLLSDKKIRESIGSVVGKDGYGNIVDTYIRTAEEVDNNYSRDPVFNMITEFTSGIQTVAIAGKVTSVLIQPASLGLAVNKMGAVSGGFYLSKTINLISQNPGSISQFYQFAEEINPAISKYTEDITKNASTTLNEMIPKIKTKIDPLVTTRDFIVDQSYRMLAEVDKVNKVLVTLSAYQQAMDGKAPGLEHIKGNHVEASKYASNVTEATQTSNDIRNLSPAQLDKHARIFMLFYNDLNNVYNATIAKSRQIRSEFSKGNYSQGLLGFGSFIMVVTAMKVWEQIARGKVLPGDEEEKDLAGFTGAWSKFILKQSTDAMLDTLPIIRDMNYALQMYRGKPVNVNIPLTSALTDVVTSVGSLIDYLGYVTDWYDGREINAKGERALWNATGFFLKIPTGAFYNTFVKEKKDTDIEKKGPLDRLTDVVDDINKNYEQIPQDFKDQINEINDRLNPKAIEIPEESYTTLKEMISQTDSYAYNEKTGASGIYQFTEKSWNKLIQERPELGLTENGRVSSNPEQQQKAFEFVTKQNVELMGVAGLEPSVENIYAAHILGPDKAVEILIEDDKVKINTLVDDKTLEENDIPKDLTIGQFKDWLLIKSVAADERLTKKINK